MSVVNSKNRVKFRLNRKWTDYISAWLLCLPALVLFAVFRFYPLFEVFRVSFNDYNFLTRQLTFTGFENYLRAFNDPSFFEALRVTFTFSALIVPLQIIIALALALFVQRQLRAMFIVRSAIFMPVVTAMVIASQLWKMMYHPTQGLFNGILSTIGLPRLPFLTQPLFAIPSLTLFILWKDVGYSMIFFLAGLQAIPDVYYEALSIDGGSKWDALRYVTIPLLRRTLVFILVTVTISTLRIFTPIYVMTLGGPRFSTNTIVFYIYQLGFVRNEMGYASTLSVLLLIIILIISVIQIRIGKSEDL